MRILCSVCHAGGIEAEGVKLMQSRCLPGSRYVACAGCMEAKLEPRPLVVLGSIYYDNEASKEAVKGALYLGSPILAAEVTS